MSDDGKEELGCAAMILAAGLGLAAVIWAFKQNLLPEPIPVPVPEKRQKG